MRLPGGETPGNATEMKMSETQSDGMKSIRKYFTVETAPRQQDKWLIVCEKCGSMWHLAKDNKHVGNTLHLLNHARGANCA